LRDLVYNSLRTIDVKIKNWPQKNSYFKKISTQYYFMKKSKPFIQSLQDRLSDAQKAKQNLSKKLAHSTIQPIKKTALLKQKKIK